MKKTAWRHFKSEWWSFLIMVIVALSASLFTQLLNRFVGYIIDYGINFQGAEYSGVLGFIFSGKLGGYGSKQLTISLCLIMFGLAVLMGLLTYLKSYLEMAFQYRVSHKIKKDVFYAIKGREPLYSSGSMMKLHLDDLYQHAGVFFSTVPNIIVTIVTIAFCLTMLGGISPYLLIAPVALSPLLIYFSVKYHKEIYQRNVDYREMDGELRNSVEETLFKSDEEKFKKFEEANINYAKERKIISKVPNKYDVILKSVKVGIYIVSCTIAGILAIKGKILLGEYLVFISFVETIYTQVLSLISSIISIRASTPKMEKVERLLEVVKDEI